VIVPADGMFFGERRKLAALAAAARLPSIYAFRGHVAIQARPSFDSAITAFASTAYDDELKKRGIDVWPQIKALLAA
jgi:hypothetical protein